MVVFWWEYPYSYKDKYSKRFNWDWALWYTTKMWVWVVHKNHFWPKMNYGIPIMYWFL
uniref:ATP synthase F0 subunit 8 n=1 Tax=Cocculina enigmadonta TaxID=2729702 RepID=UPI002202C1DC|nr:ATP synthase F0 subunit 8 [Cocculina enigmadonta]UXN84349.1 ATP synthase F0 subunit 8 [Cocculina enigmadonta]